MKVMKTVLKANFIYLWHKYCIWPVLVSQNMFWNFEPYDIYFVH